jgi:hypothetical protein
MTKNNMGGFCPEGCITDSGNIEDGGDELGIEKNGPPLGGGQGPEGAVALYVDGWKWLQ